MPSRAFDFESPKGYRLSGRIEHPGTTPRGWALLAHCFTCGKERLAAVRLARPSLLVGHSLGGAAALAAAGDTRTIRAVATIGAPADVVHVLHQFDAMPQADRDGR